MSTKQRTERRGWNLALASHLLVYLIAWLIALYVLSVLPIANFSADYTHFIAAVMLWLPVLALHLVAHVASGRQITSLENERKAYREGFSDAVRQLADRQDAVDRLTLNDEGELLELIEKPKRDLL